jgi:ABC-2 type transport system permease protein
MKLSRVWGVILRYLFLFRHSLNKLADSFYWPTVDLLLWGLTVSYVKSVSPNPGNIVIVVISGIIFWLIVWRGQYEISVNLLEELWNKNIVNMFVSPLKLREWILSVIILGFVKTFLSVLFASLVAFILYKVKIFFFGFYLIPFVILLSMTGWWVGFIVAGLVLRYGTRVEQFAWSMIYLISPFSAIYYPLAILPKWGQDVAAFVPTSYVFESIREIIKFGRIVDINKLIICFLLNLIYIILSLIFLKRSFISVLKKDGLVKLL